MTGTINIFQKEWAATSASSPITTITTAPFGPCYVVTFAWRQWVSMAHIDDTTNVESLSQMIELVREQALKADEVQVRVAGGWPDQPQSNLWGDKILKKLHDEGFSKIDTTNMRVKRFVSMFLNKEGLAASFFCGMTIDSRTGQQEILLTYEPKLNEGKVRKILSMDQTKEYPLTRVFPKTID
jgi:hypothetical protein